MDTPRLLEGAAAAQGDEGSASPSSPWRLFTVLVVAIFAVESSVMGLLAHLGLGSKLLEAILDASLLTVLAFPALWFAMLRPLVREVRQRERAARELAEAHAGMEQRVCERTEQIERAKDEVQTLATLGRLLQACSGSEEAYGVVAHALEELFPTERGSLSLYPVGHDVLEPVAAWGGWELERKPFDPAHCWGLRLGHPHRPGHGTPRCKHLGAPSPDGGVCVPMMAQGEALGVLTIAGTDGSELSPARMDLAVLAAEHIGLGLANVRLRETLKVQSIRDPLTGLFNRRYMEECLQRELALADRHKTPVSVVMLDLDHFKQLNDVYGHAAGDAVLRELGRFLRTHVRAEDIPCRYGGEEFVLLCPRLDAEMARLRCEELRRGVTQLAARYHGASLGGITASFGVATYPEHARSLEALLKLTDQALYRAKSGGRDQVVLAEVPPRVA